MYDGKQVLRIESKYKKSDLYNIGIEMTSRKGTGNYDIERTKFNVGYISLTEKNLYQEVKQTLKNRNIDYLDKPSTNLLNGITITSGPEFFQSLGMKFIDSGRTYHTGDKKGQSVLIPNIKSKEDIPNAVSYFFDSCMDFLKDYVGEENIILAQVHYDEDTPHLQAYFLPVVDTVKRKCYEKDNDGNIVKEEVMKKDGTSTIVPKLLRDNNGKIIYEEVNGKFLNCDQFWKNKGGKSSYHQMQNEFNKYITEKGFNLYRGDIGTNKENQSKLEYDIAEKRAELEELNKSKENTLKIIQNSKEALKNIESDSLNKELLNPTKRKLTGYREKDINNIIDYTKKLEKKVILLDVDNSNKDLKINELIEKNQTFMNNSELIKKNQLIKEQDEKINNLNKLITILNKNITELKNKLEIEVNKWKGLFEKLCDAIDKILGRTPTDNAKDYEKLADSINYGYYRKNNKKDKSNDLER